MNELRLALSFDDVLLEPGYSKVLPVDTQIETELGPLKLKVPVLSAAMDTVTEARTAIALALIGGLGVLHKNWTPNEQAQEVRRVKKFQHGVISNPIAVEASITIEELRNIIEQTGVTGFPVIDSKQKLVGMCTKRDVRFVHDPKLKVSDVMSSPAKSLPAGATRDDAIAFFQKNRVEKIPLVDKEGRLKGLITSRDLRQSESHPHAVRDAQGSLCVAAAVGAGPVEGLARAQALVEAGVDALVVDSAHGHSEGVLATLRELRKTYPRLALVGGNVGTAEGALALVEAGANVVKVGIGPGSICTTRIVSGAGTPQLTAVMEVAEALRGKHPAVGIVADGGIRYSGDITKALAAGAHAVMLGSLFAGTEESPGETILYQGRSYKSYRGMGSLGAMKRGSKDRYFQGATKDASKLVPEGVEARVPYRGRLSQVVHQLMGGLRAGMGYVGAASLHELHTKARFRRISPGALKESHVHDVTITAEAPNYTGGSEGG
jgi:IMP dehydrogenase